MTIVNLKLPCFQHALHRLKTVLYTALLMSSIIGVAKHPTILIQWKEKEIPKALTPIIESHLKTQSIHSAVSFHQSVILSKQCIDSVLKAYGYFQNHIECITHGGSTINYHIALGPQLKITNINVQLQGEGQSHTNLEKAVLDLQTYQGKAMTTENYKQLKYSIQDALTVEGFLSTHWVKHQVIIDEKNYTATINLVIETGPQYTVGPIKFSATSLHTHFLKRYLFFKEKEPVSLEKSLQSQHALQNSDYFRTALIHIPPPSTQSELPIHITLTKAPKYYLLSSLGIDCIDSDVISALRLKLEGRVRYLNPWGHQLGITTQYLQERLENLILYTIPGTLPITQKHYLQGKWTSYPVTHAAKENPFWYNALPFYQPSFTISYLYTRQYQTWGYQPFIAFHYESSTLKDLTQPAKYFGCLIGHQLTYEKNMAFKKAKHYTIKLHTQAALPWLSSLSFFKGEIETFYINTFKWWNKTNYLLFKGRAGTLLTPSINQVPNSFRFYAGGSDYPRGHKKYLLNPHTIGGGIELRVPLIGLLYLNPFFEINHSTHENGKPHTLKGSVGTGLCLWYPPLGRIEIDGLVRLNPEPNQSTIGCIAKISTDLH